MDSSDLNSARWFSAIRLRKSEREFSGPLTDEQAQRLSILAAALSDDDARIVLFPAPKGLFSGPLSGKLKDLSHAAAVIRASKQAPLTRAGFKGEAIVLEAAAMGVGSCWRGSGYKAKLVKAACDIKDGEVLEAIITLGALAEPPVEIQDGLRRRKPLEKLVISQKDMSLADVDPWQNAALKAARIAPSAVNSQPWRFAFTKDRLLMTRAGLFSESADLDLGIAMLHIELGAASAGVSGTWRRDDESGTVFIYTKS
jgi:hypothetical protein